MVQKLHEISSLENVIKLLGKEGMIRILLYIDNKGSARYQELSGVIKSETTLTTRLKELTSKGILNKKLLTEKYRPTEYSLSKKGKKIIKLIRNIEKYPNIL